MTKRQLANIIRMFHNGLSPELCISVIIDLMAQDFPTKTAAIIHEFYSTIYEMKVRQVEKK